MTPKIRRHWWLRDLSVVLAVVLEVLPTEWDCMLPLLQHRQLVAVFLFKMGCTTVILLPLGLFAYINGLTFRQLARGRSLFVLTVVALNLAMGIFLGAWLFMHLQSA